jgi:Na+-driven multidrug efflux pump
MRGVQDTRSPVRIVLIANGLSALLSPLLVYPAGLGLEGSAVANVAGQALGSALFLRALHKAAEEVRPQRHVMKQQLVVGRDLI